jgi:DNA-binding NarL/FixJ family response regulator
VNTHRLAKETHALHEDVLLVVMREVFALPPSMGEPQRLAGLTSRQREIALLVGRTGASYKQIAEQLSLHETTVAKHVENIHRLLGVHSRAELALLFK